MNNNRRNSLILTAFIFVLVFSIAYGVIDSDHNRGTKAVSLASVPAAIAYFIGMKVISK